MLYLKKLNNIQQVRLIHTIRIAHLTNFGCCPAQVIRFCSLLLLSFWLLVLSPGVSASTIEITHHKIEAEEEGYRLAAAFVFDLNRGLEEALGNGIPLYFTTELSLTRPRWYWFDEQAVVAKQTVRLSYNALTRQYFAGVVGSVQQSFNTLDDALFLLRRPSRWLVAGRGMLKSGEQYHGVLRMSLNLEYMPKPFQVNALNNSDWRLSSDKKSFTYKAE
jgi:hypothetical protein